MINTNQKEQFLYVNIPVVKYAYVINSINPKGNASLKLFLLIKHKNSLPVISKYATSKIEIRK